MTYTAEILSITHTGEILQSLMTHTTITFTPKVTLQSETLGISLKKDSGMNNTFFFVYALKLLEAKYEF